MGSCLGSRRREGTLGPNGTRVVVRGLRGPWVQDPVPDSVLDGAWDPSVGRTRRGVWALGSGCQGWDSSLQAEGVWQRVSETCGRLGDQPSAEWGNPVNLETELQVPWNSQRTEDLGALGSLAHFGSEGESRKQASEQANKQTKKGFLEEERKWGV